MKPLILIPSYRAPSFKGGELTMVCVEFTYLNALFSSGAVPVIIPIGSPEEDVQKLSGIADGLLIPGGGDIDPARYGEIMHETVNDVSEERDEMEFSLVKYFLEKKKPIFGICRGMQVLNVVMEEALHLDVPSEIETEIMHQKDPILPLSEQMVRDSHDIIIEDGSALARFFGMKETSVNSLHHQAVKAAAKGLRIGAKAPDGVIEEIESVDMDAHFLLGVQWHPEAILERHPENMVLFQEFVRAAMKR